MAPLLDSFSSLELESFLRYSFNVERQLEADLEVMAARSLKKRAVTMPSLHQYMASSDKASPERHVVLNRFLGHRLIHLISWFISSRKIASQNLVFTFWFHYPNPSKRFAVFASLLFSKEEIALQGRSRDWLTHKRIRLHALPIATESFNGVRATKVVSHALPTTPRPPRTFS